MDFKNILEGTRPFFQGLPFQGLPLPSPTTAQLLPSQILQPMKDGGPLRKFEEGLGATLSQMYSNTTAPQSTTPSSSCSPNGNQVVGSKGVSSSRSSTSTQSLTTHQVQNAAGPSNAPVFNMVVRRESPLDLSVKTVRQSADSSTNFFWKNQEEERKWNRMNDKLVLSTDVTTTAVNRPTPSHDESTKVPMGMGIPTRSPMSLDAKNLETSRRLESLSPKMAVIDGGNSLANRSLSSSGASTPINTASNNSNNTNSMGSVIAAAANSTTNLLKDHHNHQGHGSSEGRSSSSSSSHHAERSKSKKIPNNNTNSNSAPNEQNLNLSSPHHLFGHPAHPTTAPHNVHSMNAVSRSGVVHSYNAAVLQSSSAVSAGIEVQQQNHHLHHSQHQQQHHAQQQQQQAQQRPSSVIPPYNPPPPTGLSPYHQYHQAQSQHHPAYHHVAYSQYHPHFPAQSQPTTNHAGTGQQQQQQHLGYYPPYGHNPHTPVSLPSAPAQVQNSGGSSNNHNSSTPNRDSSASARSSASQNPPQTHSQVASSNPGANGGGAINYPGKSAIVAHSPHAGPQHYHQVPTQIQQPAYYPPQHGPHNSYYANTTATANRPQQEATSIQHQYPGQQQKQHGYNQNYNHYQTAQNQLPSFGNYHYPPQLHHHQQQQQQQQPPPSHILSATPNPNNPGVAVNNSQQNSSLIKQQQQSNPNFPPNLVVGRGSNNSVSVPRPLPTGAVPNHSMPIYQSDPSNLNPNSSTVSLKTTPHNHLVSSVPPPPHPSNSSRTTNTKQGHSRGSPREGKTSSRKNLLSLLRNSCESRIHEKQEKEKFQFNHQTWNFHGRKFNVLPPLGNSNGVPNCNNTSTNSSNSSESNLLIGITSTPTTALNMGTGIKQQGSSVHAQQQQPTSLQVKAERDSQALFSDNGAQNYNSLTTLNRIRTKAEKKQLFPNLLSQIEQENSSRAPLGGGESENNRNINKLKGGKGGLKPATSVFDFQDDDDEDGSSVVKTNSVIKTMKKSPVKNSRGQKKDFLAAAAAASSSSAMPLLPVPKSVSTTLATTTTMTNSFYKQPELQQQQLGLICPTNGLEINGKDSLVVASTAAASTPNKSIVDNIDSFWEACDSFLTDLASNPTTIKSRRGGLWQKLKSKTKSTNKTPKVSAHQSKGKRTLKNSSEDDSDFKVEESSSVKSEVEEEEESTAESSVEDEENSDLDDEDAVENSSNVSGESQSKSDEVVPSSRKRKQPTQDNSRKSSSPASSIRNKRRKSSPTTTTRRASSNNNNHTNNKNESIVTCGKTRGRTSATSNNHNNKTPDIGGVRRRSKRKLSSGGGGINRSAVMSEEDATSRTSIGSESEENSDESESSSQSFSVGSFDSDSENSDDSSSGDRHSDSSDSSASDSEDFDIDSNSASSENLRKSKRNKSLTASPNTKLSKGKKKKSLRNSTKSLSISLRRRKSNRSSSKRNKKSSSKNIKGVKTRRRDSKDDRGGSKRNSGKIQSLRRKLRPKRNCAPVAGKGRLRDISGESGEEGQQHEGSSGEEWIMRGELGKKKRRVVFGDGSDFSRPGWEQELIDFKKKLRMPSKLIRVAKPSSLSASTSVVGGNSSSSSVTKDFDSQETSTGDLKVTKEKDDHSPQKDRAGRRTTTKGRPPKNSPSKVEAKSCQPVTRNTSAAAVAAATTPNKNATVSNKSPGPKGKGKSSKQTKSSVKENEEKIEKGAKNLKEKPVEVVEVAVATTKTPTKSPNKRDKNSNSKKNSPEKVNKTAATPSKVVEEQPMEPNTAVLTEDNKNEDKYTKLTKGKEAQMLPTPGAAGNKFNKKMSIKSVFGIDLPTTTPIKKTLRGTRRNKFKSGFDYIRKKKRVTSTPDGTVVAPLPPKRIKTNVEKTLTEEDVQAEMRGWVLNKGLGETILHRAARLGYPDVASYCLEHDICSPNCKDNAGYSPLHETCIKGNLEVAKVLLAYGANPSQTSPGGIRPLHEACENGHVELVRLLISYGADPLLATYAGQSPMELAEPFQHVKSLLEEHIKDVQGRQETSWLFRGSGPWAEVPYDNGFDLTGEAPSPESISNDPEAFEFEGSENVLPPLYRLKGEVSFYVLLQDFLNYIGQTKDRFLKNNPGIAETIQLNSNDFLEQAQCCHLLGEKFNLNSSSDLLTLIKYNSSVKKMLNIENSFIS